MGHRFSLPAKLEALAVGETIFIPDPKRHMDRALITCRQRSPRIAEYEFEACRRQYIEDDQLKPILKITRKK